MASITINHTATYPYPAEVVFEAAADIDLEPKWQATLLRVWHAPEGPMKLGTTISREGKIMGKPTCRSASWWPSTRPGSLR